MRVLGWLVGCLCVITMSSATAGSAECFHPESFDKGTKTRLVFDWQTARGAAKTVITSTVLGKRRFRGKSRIAVRNLTVTTTPTGEVIRERDTDYMGLNRRKKIVYTYGNVSTVTINPGVGDLTARITTVESPPLQDRFGLRKNKPHTLDNQTKGFIKWIELPPGVPPEVAAIMLSSSLPADSSQTNTTEFLGMRNITVPAGSFRTCLYKNTEITDDGTSISRHWVSVDHGIPVKSSGDGLTMTLRSATINGNPL